MNLASLSCACANNSAPSLACKLPPRPLPKKQTKNVLQNYLFFSCCVVEIVSAVLLSGSLAPTGSLLYPPRILRTTLSQHSFFVLQIFPHYLLWISTCITTEKVHIRIFSHVMSMPTCHPQTYLLHDPIVCDTLHIRKLNDNRVVYGIK